MSVIVASPMHLRVRLHFPVVDRLVISERQIRVRELSSQHLEVCFVTKEGVQETPKNENNQVMPLFHTDLIVTMRKKCAIYMYNVSYELERQVEQHATRSTF